MGKSVTLSDIAKACNTSNVTVSKALTDKKGVSDELRIKIKQIAKQMGYEPPKTTASKNSRMIGVIIPKKFMNPNGSFYWSLYNHLVDYFKQEASETGIPYQTLINLYLEECVNEKKKFHMSWK